VEFLGHTEHLARRLRARSVVMSFVSDALTTALVTTHIPLSEVAGAIDAEGVANAAVHLARLIAALRKRANGDVRIAIASLNPHAGEGGLLGHEESRAIVPGIALARKRLLGARIHPHLEGPVPAETAFRRAANGGYHGVVAMYHDQATIPMKCLAFGDAVNVTLGLPIVRTSVDHGTGYDIAGKGIADAEGMQNAIALGAKLAKSGLVTDAAR
jgi:4-hydroxythreonine-4-phosphate dehydrogenase